MSAFISDSLNSQFSLSLSYDDVLLEPGYSQVLPGQVELKTNLGAISLGIPLMTAAMDTVTESSMAIAIALMGGVGILHKNGTAADQAREVKRVKKFQHAVISSPLTVFEDDFLSDVIKVIEETGVTGFPVVNKNGILVGMCTGRDMRFIADTQMRVSQVMTSPVKSLPETATRPEAEEFFRKYRVEKLPLVDKAGKLKGLMTSKDLRQATDAPLAVRDETGRLRVGAAVGIGDDEGFNRASQLVEVGCDILVVDSAHGHSEGVISTVRKLSQAFPKTQIVGGNIATVGAAKALIEAGAHIVKVGVGPGSICTTRIVSGAGVPQLTAVSEVAQFVRKNHPNVGVIADGGLRYSGDITKALAAGAHAVMAGSLFAGTDESPGELILYQGRSYKSYRGMGSLSAMKKGSATRYFQDRKAEMGKLVPEGVEARVPYKGPLSQVVYQLMGGLRSGMGYVGAANLGELHDKARFRRITSVGLKESHVHDVSIIAESPNYSGGHVE
jgi:IMP dehydrogenase